MKTIPFLSLLFLCTLTLGCSKDDGNNDDEQSRATYINFSVAGSSKYGTFNINDDDNNSNQNVTGLVVPNEDGNAVLVDYYDANQLMSVNISAPAAIGTYEISNTNPYDYNIGFGFENLSLEASTMSINITSIEFNGLILEHIKGSFTGVALYTYSINGDEIQEPHLVDGTFEYNVPSL